MDTCGLSVSRKLLFLVTEDWYYFSHRHALAVAAIRAGYEVILATRVSRFSERITADSITIIPIAMRRRSLNPLRELGALIELMRIYRRIRPDVVHQVGLKPVIYGTIAARLACVPAVVNALGGLGYVFASGDRLARLLRLPVCWMLQLLLNRRSHRLILQTAHDFVVLRDIGVRSKTMVVIRGAGVDLDQFTLVPEPPGPSVVLMACRLLWDKGVGDFVDAARHLRSHGVMARFVLVGEPDPDNPKSIPLETVRQWQAADDIEWWGHRDDMSAVFAQSAIVCLPTVYGEGVPKVLIEAAACGRPIVTTDMPGCREIVRHGENGLIVPVHDIDALAQAIMDLLKDGDRRREMGRHGREIAEREFGIQTVIGQTLSLYESLLQRGKTARSG